MKNRTGYNRSTGLAGLIEFDLFTAYPTRARRCLAPGLSEAYKAFRHIGSAEPYLGATMNNPLQTLQGAIILGIVITVIVDLIVRYTF